MPYGFTELGEPQPEMRPSYPEPIFPEAREEVREIHEPHSEDEETEGGMPEWLKWTIFFVAGLVIIWVSFYGISPKENDTGKERIIADEDLIGGKGGQFALSDGAKLVVPEGALDKDVHFAISKIEKKNSVTDLYHFEPDDLKFTKPVEILIPYREEKLGRHEDVHSIRLLFGSSPSSFSPVPITRIEPDKKLIGIEVMAL